MSFISGIALVDVGMALLSLSVPEMEAIIIKSPTHASPQSKLLQSFHELCGELYSSNRAMSCTVHIELGDGIAENQSGCLVVLGADCLLLRYETPRGVTTVPSSAAIVGRKGEKTAGEKDMAAVSVSVSVSGAAEEGLLRNNSNRLRRMKSTQQQPAAATAAPSHSKAQLHQFLSSIVSRETLANSASELLGLHDAASQSRGGGTGSGGGGCIRSKSGALAEKAASNLSAISSSNSNSADGKTLLTYCGVVQEDSLMYSPSETNIGSRMPGSHELGNAVGLNQNSNSKSAIFGSFRDGSDSNSINVPRSTNESAACSAQSYVRPMSLFSTVITAATLATVGTNPLTSSGIGSDNCAGLERDSSATLPSAAAESGVVHAETSASVARSSPISALAAVLDACFQYPCCSPVETGVQLASLVRDHSISLVEKDGRGSSTATGDSSKRTARMQAKLDQCHGAITERLKYVLTGNATGGSLSRKQTQIWALSVGLTYNLQLLRLLHTKPSFPSVAKAKKHAAKKCRLTLVSSWQTAVRLLKKAATKYVNSRAEGVLSRLSILLMSYTSFSEHFSDNITFSALEAISRDSADTVEDIHRLPCLLLPTAPTTDRTSRPRPDEVITSSVLMPNCVSLVQLLDYIDRTVSLTTGAAPVGESGLFADLQPHCAIGSVLAGHHPQFASSEPASEHERADDEQDSEMGGSPPTVVSSNSTSTAEAGDVTLLVEKSCSFKYGAGAGALATSRNAALVLSYPQLPIPALVVADGTTTGSAVVDSSKLAPSAAAPQRRSDGKSLVRTNSLLSVQCKVDSRTGLKPIKLVSMRGTVSKYPGGPPSSTTMVGAAALSSGVGSRTAMQGPSAVGGAATVAQLVPRSGSTRSRSLMSGVTDTLSAAGSGSDKRARYGGGAGASTASVVMPAPLVRSICIPETPETAQRDDGRSNPATADIYKNVPDATSRRLTFSTQ